MKKFLKGLFLTIIIVLCMAISAFLWLSRNASGLSSNSSYVEFEIKNGDSSHSVASRLYAYGYINSKELFIGLIRILKLDNKLKPGWVKLAPKFNTIQIINTIFEGNFITKTFTIPEGSTIKDIRKILVEKEIVSQEDLDEFLADPNYPDKIGLSGHKSAEGFLYPDTYKIFKGSSPEHIFRTMVKTCFKKIESIYPEYRNLSKKELYNVIILASIIEKEVKLREESKIISGIFYNRLKQGIKLRSCATVQFILGTPKARLLFKDLEIDHPYNTYIYRGLPPGPIGNAGKTALEAAFYPSSHNYLYFVVKDPVRGSHHFSSTYEEHLRAQKKYLQLQGYE